MKNNQSGFSIVEIIMAAVIIVLVGAVGWLYWDKVANKPAADNNAATAATQSPKPSPTTALKTHTSAGLGVAFDYPSTWILSPGTGLGKYDAADQGSESITVKSPSGFTMFFDTLASTGLGGTGPCDVTMKDVTYEGDPKIDNAHVVSYTIKDSYTGNDMFVLKLSGSDKYHTGANNCPPMFDTLIDVRELEMSSDGNSIRKPYQLQFGTSVFAEDVVSKTKPSDKEYKEAVQILKSVRKI